MSYCEATLSLTASTPPGKQFEKYVNGLYFSSSLDDWKQSFLLQQQGTCPNEYSNTAIKYCNVLYNDAKNTSVRYKLIVVVFDRALTVLPEFLLKNATDYVNPTTGERACLSWNHHKGEDACFDIDLKKAFASTCAVYALPTMVISPDFFEDSVKFVTDFRFAERDYLFKERQAFWSYLKTTPEVTLSYGRADTVEYADNMSYDYKTGILTFPASRRLTATAQKECRLRKALDKATRKPQCASNADGKKEMANMPEPYEDRESIVVLTADELRDLVVSAYAGSVGKHSTNGKSAVAINLGGDSGPLEISIVIVIKIGDVTITITIKL